MPLSRFLLILLSLLTSSMASEAISPMSHPCQGGQAVGRWAGVSRTSDVAVLLELRADGQGQFEVWARDRDRKPVHFLRPIEQWTADGGGLRFRNDGQPHARSVTVLNATARCSETRAYDITATFWIQDIAHAELSLAPLTDFMTEREYLLAFYQSLQERSAAASPNQETQGQK